jgi:hypothetical protein
MKTWQMTVKVTTEKDADELDPNDRDDSPVGNHDFIVDADTADEAERLALDLFHDTVPISVPEDFDIDVHGGATDEIPTYTPEIEVCERLGDPGKYHASLSGSGPWGAGNTPDEAIGSLVRCNPKRFGLKVTILEGKHPR